MTACGTGSQVRDTDPGDVTAPPQGGQDPEAATSYRAPPVPVNGLGNLGCGNNGVCCPVGQKLFSDPLTLPASGFSLSD